MLGLAAAADTTTQILDLATGERSELLHIGSHFLGPTAPSYFTRRD